MNRYRRKCFIVCYIASFLASVLSKPLISLAWGDSTYIETGQTGTHRTLYKQADIDDGALDDGTITFNSITDGSIGSELNFVSALSTDADIQGYWQGNDITVTDGEKYYVRLFVHNNSPLGTAGMATGTKVAISGIGQSTTNGDGEQEVEVNGFIYSDNATPKEYWDYVRFKSDIPFHLEYMYGSAMIYNRGAAGTTDPISSADITGMSREEMDSHTITGRPLSDDIVLIAGSVNGTLIGFDALDGNVPGCYRYSSYITICVKVVYDYDVTLQTQVRKIGEKEWANSIDAEIGDRVEFQLEFNNISTEVKTDVMIRDILPSSLKYVPNTTKLYNSNYPNWADLMPDGDIVDRGVNIGSYLGSDDGLSGGNAFVRFTAEVINKDLGYGSNTLVCWGQASVGSATHVESYAVIEVQKSTYLAMTVSLAVFIISTVFFIILVRKIIKLRKMQP